MRSVTPARRPSSRALVHGTRVTLAALVLLVATGVGSAGCGGEKGPVLQIYHNFRAAVMKSDWDAAAEFITVKGRRTLDEYGKRQATILPDQPPVARALQIQLGLAKDAEGNALPGQFANCFDVPEDQVGKVIAGIKYEESSGTGAITFEPNRVDRGERGRAMVDNETTAPAMGVQARSTMPVLKRIVVWETATALPEAAPAARADYARYQDLMWFDSANGRLYWSGEMNEDMVAKLSAMAPDGPWSALQSKAAKAEAKWLLSWP